MKDKFREFICPHNTAVDCVHPYENACKTCGFNPEVINRRKAKLAEKLLKEAEEERVLRTVTPSTKTRDQSYFKY